MCSTGNPVVASKKLRNLEKRREKSRYAARYRRERESAIYTSLYEMVPIAPEPTVAHVDRIAVLRLAACYCRARHAINRVFPPLVKDHPTSMALARTDISEDEIAQCTDGFLLLMDNNGLIVYVSQGVAAALGLTQTDLAGQSLDEFLHSEQDQQRLVQALNELETNAESWQESSLHLKSVRSTRGRNATVKTASYIVISFSLVRLAAVSVADAQKPSTSSFSDADSAEHSLDAELDSDSENGGSETPPLPTSAAGTSKQNPEPTGYYLFFGMPLTSPAMASPTSDKLVDDMSFMSRHTMDMRFSYCHEKISEVIGYDVRTISGMSLFSIIHAQDVEVVSRNLKTLLQTGQGILGLYRLLICGGGFVWVYSEAVVVAHSTRGHKGQYVVCTHEIVSLDRASTGINGQKLATVQIQPTIAKQQIDQCRSIFENRSLLDSQTHKDLLTATSVTRLQQQQALLCEMGISANASTISNGSSARGSYAEAGMGLSRFDNGSSQSGWISSSEGVPGGGVLLPCSSSPPSDCSAKSSMPSLSPPQFIANGFNKPVPAAELGEDVAPATQDLLELLSDFDWSQFDDLNLLAPFVPPDELLKLDIPCSTSTTQSSGAMNSSNIAPLESAKSLTSLRNLSGSNVSTGNVQQAQRLQELGAVVHPVHDNSLRKMSSSSASAAVSGHDFKPIPQQMGLDPHGIPSPHPGTGRPYSQPQPHTSPVNASCYPMQSCGSVMEMSSASTSATASSAAYGCVTVKQELPDDYQYQQYSAYHPPYLSPTGNYASASFPLDQANEGSSRKRQISHSSGRNCQQLPQPGFPAVANYSSSNVTAVARNSNSSTTDSNAARWSLSTMTSQHAAELYRRNHQQRYGPPP